MSIELLFELLNVFVSLKNLNTCALQLACSLKQLFLEFIDFGLHLFSHFLGISSHILPFVFKLFSQLVNFLLKLCLHGFKLLIFGFFQFCKSFFEICFHRIFLVFKEGVELFLFGFVVLLNFDFLSLKIFSHLFDFLLQLVNQVTTLVFEHINLHL